MSDSMNDEMETQLIRWPLRLLLQGLSPRDEHAVRRLLARAQRQLQHEWQLVNDGDAEVVLVAGLEVDTVRGMIEPPLLTLHLLPPSQDARALASRTGRAPGTLLSSPLQFDALLDALESAELRAIGGDPASFLDLSAGCHFRLRRWPPAHLMWDDVEDQRLASFMLTRTLDLDKLIRLSNVTPAKCIAFVTRMGAADLLHRESPEADAVARRPARSAPARGVTATATATATVAGLLGALRRRLGLASR
jgi:hypothetical protein